MKLLSTLFWFLFLLANCFAQDRIYYKNGNVAEAKILEISKDEIVFKKASNPDGPTYRELKSTIDKLVYSNGTVESFAGTPEPQKITIEAPQSKQPEEKVKPEWVFKKNAITYSVSDVLFKRATFAFEHLFGKGYIGIKIPISFGLGSNKVFDVDYLNSYNNDNSTTQQQYNYVNYTPPDERSYTSIVRKNTFGLELNAYPFGQHKVSFFVGPAFYYGLIDYGYSETRYTITNSTYYYQNYITNVTYNKAKSNSYSGMINTGFAFKSNSDFSINLQIGLGFRQNKTDFDDYTATVISPSFQIGYTF